MCGEDENSCWDDGNRWSIVYTLGAITMLLLAVNSVILILGAWSFHMRSLSACCASLCTCLNLGAIVTIGVFRFNTFGKFSALCTGPAKYDGINAAGTEIQFTDTAMTDFLKGK